MPGSRKKTALAIRHVAFEDLGSLAPSLHRAGYRVEYREAGLDRLAELPQAPDLLVVLGGPIGAYEEDLYPFIKDELRLLERRLAAGLPTLGVCLGAQMMARALGAKVSRAPRKELGWGALSLSAPGLRSSLRALDGVSVLHWHGDTFDIPAGAISLASTHDCPNQAFSWGRSGLALQFHAEVSAPALERWYVGHACEISATAGASVAQLRADAVRYAPALEARAAKLWAGWLDQLQGDES